MAELKCPACNGTGDGEHHPVEGTLTCGTCLGSGTLEVTARDNKPVPTVLSGEIDPSVYVNHFSIKLGRFKTLRVEKPSYLPLEVEGIKIDCTLVTNTTDIATIVSAFEDQLTVLLNHYARL